MYVKGEVALDRLIRLTKIILWEKKLLVRDGVKYYKIGDDANYAVELFLSKKILAYLNNNAIESAKSSFDHLLYVSDNEASLATRFEDDENVKVYVK